mgnify:CR=1 FL=1
MTTIVTTKTSGAFPKIRGYSAEHGASRYISKLRSEDERGRHREVAREVAQRAGLGDVRMVSARLPRAGWVHVVVPAKLTANGFSTDTEILNELTK